MPHQKTARAIRASRKSDWVVAIVLGALTIAALIIGRAYGKVSGHALDPKLIAWVSAAVVLVAGVVSVTRLSLALTQLATQGSPTAGGTVRLLSAGLGYVLVLLALLAVLQVEATRLLVGAGVVGVVLGIAAQQSLGNVFAGLVLLLARPFGIGDHIRVRSGALGGVFEGTVAEMSLTYVTLWVDEVPFKVPNSAMLAAGVARLPPSAPPAAPSSPAQGAPASTGPDSPAPPPGQSPG